MESITRDFNTDENFWETNPSFKSIKTFRIFYEQDKSKNKSKSSHIMWAIAFLIDPHENNPWRNLSDYDKRMLIIEDFVNEKEFSWEKYNELVEEYYNRVLTLPEKDFSELIEKMNERKEFIKNTSYTLDAYEEDPSTGRLKLIKGTAKDLDKMVIDTAKLYEQLEIVKDKLIKSKHVDGETKGGMVESATEQGLL